MTADFANDLITVTGASGKQGAHLVPLLLKKWKRLRLVVNTAASEERLKRQYPGCEVVRADLANPQDAKRVVRGASAVFHVGPPGHPHESQLGYNMIDAAIECAESGTFKHFVYSSILNSQLRKLMNNDCKRYVEEYLIESGLDYTILQPSHFMEASPMMMTMKQPSPIFPALWNTDNAFSFLALRDLGEAGAKVLAEREKHFRAQYPLCSDEPLSYRDACKIVSEEIGKEVKIEEKTYSEAIDATMHAAFRTDEKSANPQTRDVAQRILLYYNYRGLLGSTNVLGWLLGREPTTYREWARLRVREFSQK